MYRVMIAALRNAMNSGLTRIVQSVQIASRLRVRRIAESTSGRITDAAECSDGCVAPQAFPGALGTAAPLPERIAELLSEGSEILTILDMRPGPWTFSDCAYPRAMVRVVAFDPLAGGPNVAQTKDWITPPVGAQRLYGEEQLKRLASNAFDLVFARDWVEHSYDAEQAIIEMVRIVRPRCYVLMEHHPSGAEGVDDASDHRWDFSTNEAGDFIVRSQAGEINITQKHRSACSIQCTTINDGQWWLATLIRKLGAQ
jgi:hypothetical protein